MKKRLIILGSIGVILVLLFLHQTRWGISIKEIDVLLKPFAEGQISSEIEGYKTDKDSCFGAGQIWEEPEIFPSTEDKDYYKVILRISIKNFSILPYDLKSAFIINSKDNKSRSYYAYDLLEDMPQIKGFKKLEHEYLVCIELYKNGRTDEEILKDLSELKIKLFYSNRVFQLTKTIDLSKVDLILEK